MALTQVDQGLLGTYAQYTGFKNRLINSAMVIDQRNAGASVTPSSDGLCQVDRWQSTFTAASKFSVQQNAGAVTPPTGFSNYLGITSTSAFAVTSTDKLGVQQNIEGLNVADLGWGTANAATVTLSFWVRSSLAGTFGGSIRNNDSSRSYPFTYTINSANTWEQKTVTIAGDQSGTWLKDTNCGMRVMFALGAGSSASGTAGAWAGANYWSATGATSVVGTNGATLYLTGVQLEKGSTATSFDYRPYGTELALCQRYYWQQSYTSANTRFGMGTAAATVTDGFQIPLPVTMRAVPTATLSNVGLYDGSSTFTISSLSTSYCTPSLLSTIINNSASITAGKSVQLYAINSSAYVSASAEL